MRRSYKKPRAKKVRIPKPIAPPKPERPKRGLLKKIYKELISTDINQRINALAKAMAWYDTVQAYLAFKNGGKFTTKQLRMKSNAERDRALGIKSSVPQNKERNFADSISSYEVMVNGYKPPKLAPYLRQLKSSKGTLQLHKRNMEKKHKKFLQLMYDALGVRLKVDKLVSSYRIGPDGITLDRKFVLHLRKLIRKNGLLSAVEELLPIISAHLSQQPELDKQGHKTGRFRMDYSDRYQAVMQLIHKLNQYAQSENAVRSIVRRKTSTRPHPTKNNASPCP